jgi:hypothetical protein
MNWDAVGAIGEIIGAFAVVVSLVYLAVQIRSQNSQAKLSALHEMSKEQRAASPMFANEQISDIFVRANKDYGSISEAESVQLIVVVTGLFRAWENAFLENRDGSLGANIWAVLSRDYTQPMGAESFRHIWALRKQNYDPDFQEYVNSIELSGYIAK